MSWYLATDSEVIDQFATGDGLVQLRGALDSSPHMVEFLNDGSTMDVKACIKELGVISTSHKSADVSATADGLAKLMRGRDEVFITQGFGPGHSNTKESEALERRSLKHPDHQKLIAPIARKVKKLVGEYFQAQGAAILEAIKPWLKLHMKEADKPDDAEIAAESILPDTLTPFTLTVTTQQASDYRDLISTAIDKAAAMLEAELNSGGSIPETEMTRYLQANSLEKLTGDFSDRTKQRLRNAIAKTIREGGTSDDIVHTIRDTVDEFSEKRAEMIAQTEVNDAYSFGRDGLARSAGLEEKSWIVESDNPCIVCIENEAEGWIPIDQNFPSGDSFPTAHPLCACGCDYRVRTKVQPLPVAA
jgi:hypothetical protein